MRVEAVVSDLDGTLVLDDFSISDATLAALDLLQAAHIPVIVATARTPQGVMYLKELARRVDIAVCCSGAIGWSRRQHEILWQETLTESVIQMVVDFAVAHGAGVAGFDGLIWRMTHTYSELSPGQPHGPVRRVVDSAELAGVACSTMAIRHGGGELSELETMLSGEASAATSQVGRSLVLDITPLGIDKGTGVRRALDLFDIDSSDAISFGDMPNDLPLFATTGRAYAVGNRHPDVALAADEVLRPVESDGFSQKIVELAGLGWTAS